MAKQVTHSKPSNWTEAEHELIKRACSAGNSSDAIGIVITNRGSKRVRESIRDRIRTGWFGHR